MKKESSKEKMDLSLDILNTIKRTDVSEHLYGSILTKIEQRKKSTISMKWVGTAAAILFCLISIEVYVFTKSVKNQNNSLDVLVDLPNNMLYHE